MMKKIRILIITFCLLLTILLINNKQKVVNAEEVNDEIKLDIKSYNVSYADSIYLLLGVDVENVDMENNPVSVLFWNASQTTYTKGTESYAASNEGTALIINKLCYVYYSQGIAAKEMSDVIYARAYVKVDNQEYYSDTIKYSVLDYIYDRRASGVSSDTLQLFNAMLEYGTYAQKVLNYRTDHLANSTYYEIKVNNGTLEDGFAYGRYLSGTKATLTATNNKDKEFNYWTDQSGKIVGSLATLEVDATQNNEYIAVYKEENATKLTVSTEGAVAK